MKDLLSYFNGDMMAVNAWQDKYQMKDPTNPNQDVEPTPDSMHMRLAKQFARIEFNYIQTEVENAGKRIDDLSEFGRRLFIKRQEQFKEFVTANKNRIVDELFSYFHRFNQIVPQGSIMANLGNKYVFGSLSNCFGIDPPLDSYGGIMLADQQLAQLMKRRGGVGTHLNTIRPTLSKVTNASKSSTGVPSFAERYSNTTREVAQEGRRGALMLLLSVKHPDIFRFVTMKDDRSKVTGANVSVMFTDRFMEAVEKNWNFLCTFPTELSFELDVRDFKEYEFNDLFEMQTQTGFKFYAMKIRARELFETFVNMAHSNAEPGAAYIDRIVDYAPDGVYERFKPRVCNPCGEQWFAPKDTCRLMALNYFGVVNKPFKKDANLDLDKLYEIAYMQQRLGDDLVDLEAEYIDRIIDKILNDPEPMEVKKVELDLWQGIKDLALAGRRTGNGFTALGDMLAALNLPYVSPEMVELAMKTKMRAELDATIDMAILRGTFEGCAAEMEFNFDSRSIGTNPNTPISGKNSFFQMLLEEFPEQAYKMANYGRRNVSWSTVAPTGTVSLMTQTTSGLEPLFKAFYIRRRKINANQEGVRVDFVDQNGDSWQEYGVLHPKFKEWLQIQIAGGILVHPKNLRIDFLSKQQLEEAFKLSPWYGSQADDITWQDRIKINAIIQKYTSNSLSCTVNLPENIPQDVVHNLYFEAWKAGLKGITVYREGSRTGVLVSEIKKLTIDEFGYMDAPKRPNILVADYFYVKSNGKDFAVVVGKLNDLPYELFAFENPDFKENTFGEVIKVKSGVYKFVSPNFTVDNLQLADHPDERLLCRMVSGMLRHRMNPKYIADQVDKAEIFITSFGKAIQRVLKAYVPDGESQGEACPNCNETAVIYQEGCKRCTNCGHSKC
jgi:ribonucleoside-diphosphate reductase alpha chain